MHNYKNKTITIHQLKSPKYKTDKDGIPLPTGDLVFSVNLGNNSFVEVQSPCTQEVFNKVIKDKLWRQKNIKVSLTFDEKGKVEDINIESDIKSQGSYGFDMHPDDLKELQNNVYDISTNTPASKEAVCIFKILKSKNEDGMYVELKHQSQYSKMNNITEIRDILNDLVKKKKTIGSKDVIGDKYIVEDVGNNGEYIYVKTSPIYKL